MAKAGLFLGRVIVAIGCAWGGVACDDVDRAIEQKASEVLGKETAEPAPAATPTPEPAEPEQPVAPAPAPEPATEPAEAVEPAEPVTPATPAEPAKPAATKEVAPKPKAPEPAKPAATTKPADPKPAEPVAPPPPVEPDKPAAPDKPAEPAKPATKVTVPQSEHVKLTIPARVQELLNADPRMQPWLNSTVGVIETCYEQVLKENSSASGTITFVLEMHENERPDADITSLPPQLSGIVTCGTGKLMRAKRMPLFTGKEGEKHTIKVNFIP